MARGWKLNPDRSNRGWGLLDPKCNERGYQHFNNPTDAWTEGYLRTFVPLWDEKLSDFLSHICAAFRGLFR